MRDYCESTCGDQQWDTALGTDRSPCNSDLWSASFWLADQDNHDDHDWEDDHDEEPSAWDFIFPDEVFLIHSLYLGCPRQKIFA